MITPATLIQLARDLGSLLGRVSCLEARGSQVIGSVTLTRTGTIAAYPDGAYAVTGSVPDCKVGDAVIISAANSPARDAAVFCSLNGFVATDGTVTLTIFNPTALALSSGTQNFTATVIRA